MPALRLPPLPSVRDVLKIYRLNALKQLSQNFLLNADLANRIIKKAGNLSDCHVLEVGPGPGSLTRSILAHGPRKLVVVEKDERFGPTLEMLAEAFAASNNGEMRIINDDIMKVDLAGLFPECEAKDWNDVAPKMKLIGNLPFSVSTALIIKWLQQISTRSGAWAFGRTRMTLTFQKEVAERLTAEPMGRQRCRLSVMAQAWTHPVLHFVIPGTAFVPQPDVDVGLVSFVPLAVPRTKQEFKLFEKVVRHVFSFRQKYIIRGVGTLFPPEERTEMAQLMIKLSDLDPRSKAMNLTVEDFDRLVSAYKYLVDKQPELGTYDYRASRRIVALRHAKDIKVVECTDF